MTSTLLPHVQDVAISAIRELATWDESTIEMAMADLLREPRRLLVFGGALGGDTVALQAAASLERGRPSRAKRLVVVPGVVQQQPADARAAIEAYADEVIELRMPLTKWAYLFRNERMLSLAGGLLAFSDGRETGGTYFTIEKAEKAQLPVVVVPLRGQRPRLLAPNAGENRRRLGGTDVFVFGPYVSLRTGRLDPLSELVRKMKIGLASSREVGRLAGRLARAVADAYNGRLFTVVVPMPRRSPHVASDLSHLSSALAKALGAEDGTGLLYRAGVPRGEGRLVAYRVRFDPDQHRATMMLDRDHPAFDPAMKALLLDNVITTGATMEGAIGAIRRDAPRASVTGLAITGSLDYEPKARAA